LRLLRLLVVGRATNLDVRLAEENAEARRSDLRRAEADLESARVQLQSLISPDPTRMARLVATEAPPEEGAPDGLEARIARALARRPEIRRQELVVENLRAEELLAKNNTLPRLDVLGGVGWNGLAGNTPGPAVRSLPSRLQGRDTYLSAFDDFLQPNGAVSWSLGVRLQMPLGNHEAVGKLEATRLRRDQERTRLSVVRNQVSVDVQSAYQDMSAAWAQVAAADESVRLSREQLEAQERQFSAGRATVRQVLESQDVVAQAEDRRRQAMVLYNVARSRLAASEAATFETYRLVMRR
jgi:outer membrane protein TolC